MKILVTGATGFLGKKLVQELIKQGHQIVSLQRAKKPNQLTTTSELSTFATAGKTEELSRGTAKEDTREPTRVPTKKDAIDLLQETTNFQIVQGDVIDSKSFSMLPHDIEAVFHLAGVVGYKRKDRPVMEDVNVRGTAHVLEFCQQRQIPLLHTSSVVTVGVSRTQGVLDETAVYNVPDSFGYFATKRKAEDLVVKCVQEKGLRAVIVNPSTIYGPADSLKGSRRVQLKVAEGKMPFYPSGGVSVADVDNVVQGMIAAFHKGKSGERYILAGENISIQKVFALIAEMAQVSPPRWPIPASLLLGLGRLGDWMEKMGQPALITYENAAVASWFHWYSSKKAELAFGYQAGTARSAILKSVQWTLSQKNQNTH